MCNQMRAFLLWYFNVQICILGLKLTLNIDQQEYAEGIAQVAGAVVVVHNQGKMPFPEDEGVFAKPGRLTSIGVNKVKAILEQKSLKLFHKHI